MTIAHYIAVAAAFALICVGGAAGPDKRSRKPGNGSTEVGRGTTQTGRKYRVAP